MTTAIATLSKSQIPASRELVGEHVARYPGFVKSAYVHYITAVTADEFTRGQVLPGRYLVNAITRFDSGCYLATDYQAFESLEAAEKAARIEVRFP